MSSLPYMPLADFIASKRTPSGDSWDDLKQDLIENDIEVLSPDSYLLYAEGFCITLQDGRFYPHAWWYKPVPHDTLDSAQDDLYKWRSEFANAPN